MHPSDPAQPAAEPRLLAQMLGMDGRAKWRAEELAAMFRHQMSAPLDPTPGALGPLPAGAPLALPADTATFGQLLRHPQPSLEWLVLVKELGRALRQDPDLPVPEEIASALYFLPILAARLRLGERISSLPDAPLAQAAAHLLMQPFVDDHTRLLARQSLDLLTQS